MREMIAALGALLMLGCGGTSAPAAQDDTSPTLGLLEPATDLTAFRGGRISIQYLDTAPEGPAQTTLVADRDGDEGTTGDQVLISADRQGTGHPQTLTWSTVGIPTGVYSILGTTTDATGAAATAVASGRVTVVDLPAATSFGGTDEDLFPRVATFTDGSSVVAAFAGVGPITIGSAVLGRRTSNTMLLVRHDRAGAVIWARDLVQPSTPTGSVSAFVRDVATYEDSSCVVVGQINSSATFGKGEPRETTFEEPGVFVARYDTAGALLWVRLAVDATRGRTATVYRVGTADDGSCLVAGSWFQQLSFGDTDLVSQGNNDVFVARYDADGDLQWVRRDGGPGEDFVTDIAVAPDGSCTVVGHSWLGSVFGAGEDGETVVVGHPGSGAAGREPFVARYTPSGELTWLRTLSGAGDDAAAGVSLYKNGDCVITGTLMAPASVASPSVVLTPDSGLPHPYVAKFASDGSLRWAALVELDDWGNGRSVVAQDNGGCRAFCYESGSGAAGKLVEFNTAGTQGATRGLGTSSAFADTYDAARFADDSLVITGFFRGTLTLPGATADQTITATARNDIFVIWMPPNP